MNMIQTSQKFNLQKGAFQAMAWLLETVFWASLAPFLMIGLACFIAFALGTTAEDARDAFAWVGTSTTADIANMWSVLKGLALPISLLVIAYRVMSNQVITLHVVHWLNTMMTKIIPANASRRWPYFGALSLAILFLVFFGGPDKSANRLPKYTWEKVARATIILPDGKTIMTGRAQVEADATNKRYVVTFKD